MGPSHYCRHLQSWPRWIGVDKFLSLSTYPGYPWYIPGPWDTLGISLIIAGYTMDIPNTSTCSRTLNLFRFWHIPYLAWASQRHPYYSILYFVPQHWRLGYPNPGLNKFKIFLVYLCAHVRSMGQTWYIFANPVFFDIRSLYSLLRRVALARLNSAPRAVCLELSPTVLCVCHRKPAKERGLSIGLSSVPLPIWVPNCQSGPTCWPAVLGSYCKWS